MEKGKVTYGREEGGFSVWVDGKPVAIFRIKGWMNNLLKTPERTFSPGKVPGFAKTQFEEHGKWE